MGQGANLKGYLKNEKSGAMKSFLYNPSDFDVNRDFNYGVLTAPGVSYPKFQFISGGEKNISVPLFVRGNNGEPRAFINFLNDFYPREKSGMMFQAPPTVLFAIGGYIKKVIVVSFTEKYVDFNPDLSPRQVDIVLTFKVVA